MRITKLKLVNFIGIHNGLGQDEVEIEFPDNGHVFVKLSGRNGSGKTTLLSQLHPFKDSFDDRKNLILPGKEGLKLITIEHNGHVYEIEHHYAKAASSFFREDGTILNENGAVGVCEELITQKLGITSEYFQIGKIGSNTESFIDLTPAKRKEFIGTFIPTIEKYLDAYKIANEKYKTQKKKIAESAQILSKHQDPEELKKSIDIDTESQKYYEGEINKLSGVIGGLEAQINGEKEKITGLDEYTLNSQLRNYDAQIGADNTVITEYESVHGVETIAAVNKKAFDLGTKYAKDEAALGNQNSQLSTLKGSQVTINNEITQIKSQIDNLKLDRYDSIVASIDTDTRRKAELEDAISKNKFYSKIDSCKDTINESVANFRSLMTEIYNNYDRLSECTVEEGKKNIALLLGPNYRATFIASAQALKEKMVKAKADRDSAKEERAQKEANVSQLEILDKRPAECHIDTCPFIVNALKFKNLPEELKALDDTIKKLEELNKQIDESVDSYRTLDHIFQTIAGLFKTMSNNNVVYQYFVETFGNITSFFDGVHNKEELFAATRESIDTCTGALAIFNEYNTITSRLSSNTEQKKLLDSAVKNKEIFEGQIKTKEADLKKAVDDYSELFKSYEANKEALVKEKEELDTIKKYAEAKTSIDGLLKSRNEVADKIKLLAAVKEKLGTLNGQLKEKSDLKTSYVQSKSQLDKDLDAKKIEYAEVTKLKKDLEELQKEYEKTELVADALNPKSGIPLVFIQSYLTSVERITNNLLNIAYGDDMRIKFKVTEKEFLIETQIGNTVIDDIKSASQGEVSLVTISISLALIERAISEYNVLALDEIDGALDPNNRASFIGILNSQIKKLGLEQVFLISHNNAFDSCAMDLILLKDAPDDISSEEYMKNKSIIFKV